MDNQLAVSIPANVQKAWIMVGHAKAELAKRQELKSLELQKIIQNPGTTITEIETSLATYRKVYDEMVADGQKFRGDIKDKVLAPSLAIEAKYNHKWNKEPDKFNEDYIKLEKKYTDMRVEQDKKNNEAANREKEKQLYLAHLKNQYTIIEADYRERCINEMNTMYINYLKTSVKNPDVEAVKSTIKTFGWDLTKGSQFVAQYITDADKKELAATLTNIKPVLVNIQAEMLKLVDDKFTMYQHDLKSYSIAQVEVSAQMEIQDLRDQTAQEIGINSLAAQAVETPTIITEGKQLRKSVEVVIEGSKSWASIVCMRFWSNPLIADHVTVKNWENLTVKQMSSALGKWSSETGEMFDNLQYREVVK